MNMVGVAIVGLAMGFALARWATSRTSQRLSSSDYVPVGRTPTFQPQSVSERGVGSQEVERPVAVSPEKAGEGLGEGLVDERGTHRPLSVSDCEAELVNRWGANWKDVLISEARQFCWKSRNGLRQYLTALEGLCNSRMDSRLRSMGILVVADKEKVDRSEFFFEAVYEAERIFSNVASILSLMDTGPKDASTIARLNAEVEGLLEEVRPYVGPGLGAYLSKWKRGVYTPYYREIADRLGIPVEDVSGDEGRRIWVEWLKDKRDREYVTAPCVGG